eukprot:scaffold273934_cov21-Tisochrysis_lutea.AAC.1
METSCVPAKEESQYHLIKATNRPPPFAKSDPSTYVCRGAAAPLVSPQKLPQKERDQVQAAPRSNQLPDDAAAAAKGAMQGLAQQQDGAGAYLGHGAIQGAER